MPLRHTHLGACDEAHMHWEKRKFVIWCTTYPEFSSKYYETVCTAAVDVETGKLARLYPLSIRQWEEKIGRWDIIEATVAKSASDPRPESWKVQQDSVTKVARVPDQWDSKRAHLLRPATIFQSLEALREAEFANKTSLGVVRVASKISFGSQRKRAEEQAAWEEKKESATAQKQLFIPPPMKGHELQYLPFLLRARFRCGTPDCNTEHDVSIRDWGIYVYCIQNGKSVEERIRAGKEQLARVIHPLEKESYLLFGNTLEHPQSFMLIGFVDAPREQQRSLAI